MRSFIYCEKAVSITVSYVLLSGISLIFFTTLLLTANDLLIKGPTNIVIEEQYGDIGNMISTKIMYMYLIAPENGNLESDYRIPAEIGRQPYTINAELANIDQIIVIRSTESDKSISVTLNGIATNSMGINGTAYSSTSNHMIRYKTNET
jgi:hypothetical protein